MPRMGVIALFAVATFVLTATPGPGVLYVVGRSVAGGRRAGIASMLGIETGEAVYIAGAAIGITAVLAASPVALSILRYGGAAYLVLLGIRAWRQREEHEPDAAPAGHWGGYGRGLVVQLLNPKVAVFFVAYFPQFIRTGHPVAPQVLLLGVVYLAVAICTDTAYVLLASWLSAKLARSERAQRRRARVSAITYFALAAAALLLGDRGSAAAALGLPGPVTG
jgi:threonine/homoserine/homoserine lactone efflux protein